MQVCHLCIRYHVQCVAVSPCNDRVAAGDTTGRILIWHGVGAAVAVAAAGDDAKPPQSQSQQPQVQQDGAAGAPPAVLAMSAAVSAPPLVVTSVHWHAHAVRALVFSLDAQRLLSGGDEAVLVRSPRFVASSPVTPFCAMTGGSPWPTSTIRFTVYFQAREQCCSGPYITSAPRM